MATDREMLETILDRLEPCAAWVTKAIKQMQQAQSNDEIIAASIQIEAAHTFTSGCAMGIVSVVREHLATDSEPKT